MAYLERHSSGTHPVALRELDDLRTRLDQLMHAAFTSGWPALGGAEPWAPMADIEDAEDAYLVELELPGIDKKQITVEVSEGELGVHGEVKQRERTGVVRRRTRRVGQFSYRTTLPPNADTEHISAELSNGVLTVRVPKSEKGQTQHIEITG
ncbi:Hsp20/alpha crystallin family protein [Streptomyces sp. NPDC005251]|uniref:Hsp20/alpha crystallin family protein n=1 Tax=Streptomyces sp. NPDC005251 TaxID=3157166 RepID=UPI0033B2EF39